MKSPIDIPELFSAALDIEQAKKTPVSVNILIDETASPSFQSFVRAGFNTESPNARVMVSYFPTQTPDPSLNCDVVVIAAGENKDLVDIAAAFKAEGRPTLIVTMDAEGLEEIAKEANKPLDARDVVSAKVGQPLDEDIKGELADQIGSWVAKYAEDKKLAFSLAYPFVRKPIAKASVNLTAAENAGVGLIAFSPAADMPIMTANQAKMILQIAAAYGQPLSKDRVKEIGAVIGGALLFRGISRQVAGLIPAIGPVIKAGMGYAGTVVVGNAAIDYFENGGDMAGLAAVVSDARQGVMEAAGFVATQPLYKKAVSVAGPKVAQAGEKVARRIAPIPSEAMKTLLVKVDRKKQ